MGTVTLTLDEYRQLLAAAQLGGVSDDGTANVPLDMVRKMEAPAPKKRKTSAYNRRYKAAFKKVSGKFKLKNGNWKANGFRSAVRAAHKMAGGKK